MKQLIKLIKGLFNDTSPKIHTCAKPNYIYTKDEIKWREFKSSLFKLVTKLIKIEYLNNLSESIPCENSNDWYNYFIVGKNYELINDKITSKSNLFNLRLIRMTGSSNTRDKDLVITFKYKDSYVSLTISDYETYVSRGTVSYHFKYDKNTYINGTKLEKQNLVINSIDEVLNIVNTITTN